jgi:hypothetical protein
MSLPVSASVPDLAMTIPTGFAAALGIWFATTTAILLAEAGLARRIAKFPVNKHVASAPRHRGSGWPTVGATVRDYQTEKRTPPGSPAAS